MHMGMHCCIDRTCFEAVVYDARLANSVGRKRRPRSPSKAGKKRHMVARDTVVHGNVDPAIRPSFSRRPFYRVQSPEAGNVYKL
jgi:hypothetical protein